MAETLTRNNAPRARGRLTLGDLDDFAEVANAVHGSSKLYGNPADIIEDSEENDDMNTATTEPAAPATRNADDQPYRGIGALAPDLDKTVDVVRYDVGEDVFDVIEGLSSSRAQLAAYRALGNSTMAQAVYKTDFLISAEDNPSIDAGLLDNAQSLRNKFLDVHAFCDEQCRLLGRNPEWDRPMSAVAMFDFLANNEPNTRDNDDKRFEARIADLDADEREELRILRKKRARDQALRRQKQMRDRRDVILGELVSQGSADDFDATLFDARTHAMFFDKVLAGLKKARNNAAIGNYEDADSDTLELKDAIPRVDKANIAFRRFNKAELLTTDDLRAAN